MSAEIDKGSLSPANVLVLAISTFYGIFLAYMLQIATNAANQANQLGIYQQLLNITSTVSGTTEAFQSAGTIAFGVICGIVLLGGFSVTASYSFRRKSGRSGFPLLILAITVMVAEPIITLVDSWGEPGAFSTSTAFTNGTSVDTRIMASSLYTSMNNTIYAGKVFAFSLVDIAVVVLLLTSIVLYSNIAGRHSTTYSGLAVVAALAITTLGRAYVATFYSPQISIDGIITAVIVGTTTSGQVIQLGTTSFNIDPYTFLKSIISGFSTAILYLPWVLWLVSIFLARRASARRFKATPKKYR